MKAITTSLIVLTLAVLALAQDGSPTKSPPRRVLPPMPAEKQAAIVNEAKARSEEMARQHGKQFRELQAKYPLLAGAACREWQRRLQRAQRQVFNEPEIKARQSAVRKVVLESKMKQQPLQDAERLFDDLDEVVARKVVALDAGLKEFVTQELAFYREAAGKIPEFRKWIGWREFLSQGN